MELAHQFIDLTWGDPGRPEELLAHQPGNADDGIADEALASHWLAALVRGDAARVKLAIAQSEGMASPKGAPGDWEPTPAGWLDHERHNSIERDGDYGLAAKFLRDAGAGQG